MMTHRSVLLVIALAACAPVATTAADLPPIVHIASPAGDLVVGDVIQLVVSVRTAANAVVADPAVTWSSNRPDLVSVSATGEAHAIAVGSARILAQSGGATDSLTLTVTASPAATIALSAPEAPILIGQDRQIASVVLGVDGRVLPNATLLWQSTNTGVAIVSKDGLVHAYAAGLTTIQAQSGNVTAAVTLAVYTTAPTGITLYGATTPILVGQSRQLAADVTGADGRVLINGAVVWRSSTPSVISVSSDGVATALITGSATITATSANVSASVTLTAAPGELIISPQNIQIAVGDSLKLTATPYDPRSGVVQAPLLATWTSSNPQYITVRQDGWAFAHLGVSGTPYGSSSITATGGGISGQLLLSVATITPGLPAGIRFVHAASDLGTLTFKSSSAPPMSLVFGEVREATAVSGNLRVDVDGFAPLPPNSQSYFTLGQSFSGLVPPGQHLTLYATGDNPWGILAALWDQHAPIAPDSVLIRILYASNYSRTYAGNNLYILPTGAAIDAHPLLCYVDLAGESTDYAARAAGGYDIVVVDATEFVLASGNFGTEVARFHITPAPGHATTYVITGKEPSSMSILTVADP